VCRMPWLWRFSYASFDWAPIYRFVQPFRSIWNRIIARRFTVWLITDPPAAILMTHFLPADLCSTLKKKGLLKTPSIVVVTDLYAHRFWLSPYNEAFVVATNEAAEECLDRGISSAQLQVIGIPVKIENIQLDNLQAAYDRYGLNSSRKTILITSGGTTVGPFEAVVTALAELEKSLPGKLQIMMVCGTNGVVAKRMKEKAKLQEMPMHIFGFVNNMSELMRMSDLVVAKAGGLTITEAISHGLPLVLYHAIPGQEYRNAQYLDAQGSARFADHPSEVAAAVVRYFTDTVYASTMNQAVERLKRPHAGRDIIEKVVEPLLKREGAFDDKS